MRRPERPTDAGARAALVTAAQRLLARSARPFHSADIEHAAGVPAGSLDDCFGGREAFATAVAGAVRRSLKAQWHPDAPPAAGLAPATASARRPSRDALIEAGKRLLSSDLLDGYSIDGIVREAGVAKGSFFNHFSTRDELVRAVLRTVQDELAEVIHHSTASLDDPAERLAVGVVSSLRYGLANRLGAQAMTRVTPDATEATISVNAALRQLLVTGMAEGSLLEADVEAALIMSIGLIELGLMRLLAIRDDAARVEALLRELCLTQLQMLGVSAKRQAHLAQMALDAPWPAPAPVHQKNGGEARRPAHRTR